MFQVISEDSVNTLLYVVVAVMDTIGKHCGNCEVHHIFSLSMRCAMQLSSGINVLIVTLYTDYDSLTIY